MTNLIPQEHKDGMRREYRLRFFAVMSLFAFFALGISIVALLPMAFSVGADYFLTRQASPEPAIPEDEKKLEKLGATLQEFREILGVLDPRKEGVPVLFSELTRLIFLQKPEGISIQSFSFHAESDTTKKMVLSGIAGDRESLVAFSRRLSENKTFSQVDFPISNLSKRENIEFSVTLSVVQEKKEETEETQQ